VLIGVSTGGPRSLEDVLPYFPEDFPLPVLVAQHDACQFYRAVCGAPEVLPAHCHVLEADHPMPVERGKIYVGKGGADMVLTKRANKLTVMPKPEITRAHVASRRWTCWPRPHSSMWRHKTSSPSC